MNTNLNKTIRSKKKGFTLVELLVVISIIGVLTIIALASFSSAQKKGRDARRKVELDAAYKALMMYYTDYGVFPSTTAFQFGGVGFTGANGYVYMKVTPEETKDGLPELCYVVDSTNKKMGVFSMLENTNDSQCNKDESGNVEYYTHCDDINTVAGNYCFAVVSPNIAVTDLAGTRP